MQNLQSTQNIEQLLLQTVKTLSLRRAVQVLDFARWLQTQPPMDEGWEEEITVADLEAEEEAWQRIYATKKDTFRHMAQQALRELDAGETLEMTVENGKIRPR